MAVGYWSSPNQKELPDPRILVGEPYAPELRDRISEYLTSGGVLMACFGFSHCRFECGVSNSEMGVADLTDGIWVWLEGLHHYVRHHDVRLPAEFMQTMRESGWRVRDPVTATRLSRLEDYSPAR
jgi:hypothetical protein